MSKHIHAELMLQYAKDAMETDKPWERWEYFSKAFNEWTGFTEGNPSWLSDYKYRRKKDTIIINGHEVPKSVNKPLRKGQEYFLVDVLSDDLTLCLYWNGDREDKRYLERGLIHLDEESAIIHAKALLSFTTKDTDE